MKMFINVNTFGTRCFAVNHFLGTGLFSQFLPFVYLVAIKAKTSMGEKTKQLLIPYLDVTFITFLQQSAALQEACKPSSSMLKKNVTSSI